LIEAVWLAKSYNHTVRTSKELSAKEAQTKPSREAFISTHHADKRYNSSLVLTSTTRDSLGGAWNTLEDNKSLFSCHDQPDQILTAAAETGRTNYIWKLAAH